VKVGDLVKDNHPSWLRAERIGVIVGMGVNWTGSQLNQSFNILWRDGTIGKNVWDYDLKIVKSS
tara:strand:+ start:4489 stop:4680 length:192 start_codon:yes stop_codon:yes gene_type:complete